MPISLSNVAVEAFRDQFTNVYQAAAVLGNTSQSVMSVVGEAYKWPIQGAGLMVERGAFQSLLPVSDIDYNQVTTTFDNYVLNLPVDIFQQAELNINAMQSLGSVHAKAAGRREDQFIIDALNTTTTSPIAADGKNMTVEKIVAAATQMDEANVDADDRFLIMTPSQLKSLMSEETATSTLYVNNHVLMNGQIDTFMGFRVITIGNRDTGGLPKDGDNRTCFAWQKDAVGRAYSLNPHTEVDWSPAHQSWLTISRMRCGASALLSDGIVPILCDETA
tara:strand:+ start:40 stop:870 length:831 start_codon:yes stop_codon:yes gene_type:complete